MAIVTVTSSLIRGTYLVIWKSLRLIVAVALAPMPSFFIMFRPCLNKVTFSVTGLVMPLSVSSPAMLTGLSPSNFTDVDLKVAVGNCEVSRNSAFWMLPLNSSEPVSTDLVSITRSTEPVLAAGSKVTVPVGLLKRDSWVEKPMWSYEKRTKVLSVVGMKVVGAASTEALAMVKATAAIALLNCVIK